MPTIHTSLALATPWKNALPSAPQRVQWSTWRTISDRLVSKIVFSCPAINERLFSQYFVEWSELCSLLNEHSYFLLKCYCSIINIYRIRDQSVYH